MITLTEEESIMNGAVNHPSHYTSGGVEDLKKSRVHLDWIIEFAEVNL